MKKVLKPRGLDSIPLSEPSSVYFKYSCMQAVNALAYMRRLVCDIAGH